MDRERQGKYAIGGSDVASIVGVSSWDTPLSTFLRIMGEKPPTPDNPAMEWGRKLEPLVLEKYAEREGEVTVGHDRQGDPTTFYTDGTRTRNRTVPHGPASELLEELRHPEHNWMMGHVDGLAVEGDGTIRRLVEAKTTGQRAGQGDWGDDGTDEIPVYYMTQVQWYQGLLWEILGREIPADVPVLFGDKRFRVYHIEFDRDIYLALKEQVTEFWEIHVLPEEPPPAQAGDSKALEVLYPRHEPGSEKEVEYGTDLYEQIRELKEVREIESELEEREDRLANRIKEQMGEVKRLTGPGFTINWTRTKDSVKVDWQGVVEDLREELRRWKENHLPDQLPRETIETVEKLIDDLEESNEEISWGYRMFRPMLKGMDDGDS